jgi:hypothetical protein
MGLEDLLALEAAAEAEAEAEAREKAKQPATEAMTCTLQSGARVVFDVPNTRR